LFDHLLKHMKKSSLSLLKVSTVVAASLAIQLVGYASSAHAQFGGLLQNLMQMQQQQQQTQIQQQQLQQVQQNANPVKKFAPAQSIPADVQMAGRNFSQKVKQEQLRPLFERLYIEGERNATLNFQRIGLAALAAGHTELAEQAFESAVFRIDQIYADNPEAQKAKSLWTAEKIKDYKGEPYERAMAMFYRGLVYAAKGDFQNARALFKQADYQDTVSESEQYAGDFGLMPYMAGWASYCDGNSSLAKDFLQMAIKGDKNYVGVSVEQPVIVLFETGRAPFKYGAGKHGEELKWAAHTTPAENAVSACTTPGNCLTNRFVLGADVNFQATTRGGRPFDSVLGGKASFKEGAQNVAQVANVVGQVGLGVGGRDGGNLGIFGMFAGMVAQGVAASTQAQADIREWEQLPNTVWLATAAAKSSANSLNVSVQSGTNQTNMQATRLIDTPRCQLYWGRSVSPLSLQQDAGPVEPGAHKRDPAFRQELEASFAN
jgi:tetratricopeptide (TPR) repeat protein